MVVPTACNPWKSAPCERCGRYFATLIENIALFFRGLLTDQSSFKGALNAFVAEEEALEDLGA